MSYYRHFLLVLTGILFVLPAQGAVVLFDDSTAVHDFVVPTGVTTLHVLGIGGGAGGGAGLLGGGASGYLEAGVFAVTPGSVYAVGVGAGGKGVTSLQCGNMLCGIGNGGASWFGDLLVARGGNAVSLPSGAGDDGGSGGGAACNAGSIGGAGGTAGSNGSACASGRSSAVGLGQGQDWFAAILADFATVTAGAGGAGGTGTHAGGGGGGGLLVDGQGPTAGSGSMDWSAQGGSGYGAGGGSGSFDTGRWPMYGWGGAGAPGMVLVQYDTAASQPMFKSSAPFEGASAGPGTDIPEPGSVAILGLAALAGGLVRPLHRRWQRR